jgi:hypothetical protein
MNWHDMTTRDILIRIATKQEEQESDIQDIKKVALAQNQ